LITRCAELDQPAIALADAQGVYGAPRFHMASKKASIRALIGAEVSTTEGCRYTLLAENRLVSRCPQIVDWARREQFLSLKSWTKCKVLPLKRGQTFSAR
jgi:PHP domain